MRAFAAVLAFLAFLFVLLPTWPALGQDVVLSDPWEVAALSGAWKVDTNDHDGQRAAELDDSTWATLELPEPMALAHRPRGEIIWLRRRVELPRGDPPPLAASFGMVNGAYELFVNGERVGACGSVEPFHSAPGESCSFSIPRELVDGRTHLALALRVRQPRPLSTLGRPSYRRLGNGAYFIGPRGEVHGLATSANRLEELSNTALSATFGGLSFVLGVVSLWLYVRRRDERAHLLFALMMVIMIGTTATYVPGLLSFEFVDHLTLQGVTWSMFSALYVEFFQELVFRRRPGRFARVLQGLYVLLGLGALSTTWTVYSGAWSLMPLAVLVLLGWNMLDLVRAGLAGNRTARIMAASMVSVGGVDVAMGFFAHSDGLLFSLAAFVFFAGSMWLVLVDRLATKLKEAEAGELAVRGLNSTLETNIRALAARETEARTLNDELQRQIALRSRQLSEVLSQLGALPRRASHLADGELVDGRYRIVRQLGAGGMGAVYEVLREGSDEPLALKVLLAATDGASLARFAREAEVAATVRHENLVAVKDVGVSSEGQLYLVMELVEGSSLEALHDSFGDTAWARPILLQVANGLAALHEKGVVHRDLKPANVLLQSNGRAKLADFGIAGMREVELAVSTLDEKFSTGPTVAVSDAAALAPTQAVVGVLAATTPAVAGALDATTPAIAHTPALVNTPARLTQDGALIGTPLYMAPEHAQQGSAATNSAADIWSFGVLATELLTGKMPFDVVPLLHVLGGHALPKPRLDIDSSLREVIGRCLALEPADRPTAVELAREFRSEAEEQ